MRIALWIVGLGIAIFVVFAIIGSNDPAAQDKARARAGIELCWSEQARKSLSPSEQQFIAGTCEGMERSFVDKYHTKP